MATVPGVTPFQLDDPSTGGQLGGRTQVDDRISSPPPLRPVAAPTDTFKRAPAFSDPTLQRIADSLGQLAPAIYAFGDAQQVQQNKVIPGQVQQALAGKSSDEMQQILATNPLFQNHVANNFGHALLGQTMGDQAIQDAATDYNTNFDKQNGNFSQWSNGFISQRLAQIKDPLAAEAFMKRVQPGIEALRGQQTQFGIQQQQQDQGQLLEGSFRSTMNEALEKGTSPADTLAAVRQTMSTAQTIARLPTQQQNQLLLSVMQRQLDTLKSAPDYEKRYQMISGMLQQATTDPRTGDTHSLLDDSVVGGAAHDIQMKANDLYWTREQQNHTDEVSRVQQLAETADPSYFAARDALIAQHPTWASAHGMERYNNQYFKAQESKQVQLYKQQADIADQASKQGIMVNTGIAALTQGQAHSVSDQYYDVKDPQNGNVMINPKTGQPSTGNVYKAKDIIQDATDRVQDQIDRQYANDPQGRFSAMVQLYGSNGLINKQWQEQLKGGPLAASNALTAGGDVPPSLSQSLQLWRNLHAVSPNLLAAHSDQKTNDFFGLADTAMKSLGYNEQQALSVANRAMNDPNFTKAMPDTDKRQTIASVQANLGTWWKTPFVGYDLSNVKNSQEVASQVVEAAELKHRTLGMPMDKAVSDVAPLVTSRYHIVNGYAVDVGSKEVPQNFDRLATRYVQDFAAQHADELAKRGMTADDLNVLNVGDGKNWVLFGNGAPLPSGSFPGAGFSTQQLYKTGAVLKREDDTAEREKQDRYLEPMFNTGDPSKGAVPFWGLTGPALKSPGQILEANKAAQRKFDRDKKAQDDFNALHPNDPTLGRVIPGL